MRILLALSISLLAAEAHAISSYNPTQMACAEVKAVIRQEGAVMLRWTSPTAGVPRYGRYVRSSSYCHTGERAQGTLVPTRDRKSCGVNDCRPFYHNDFF
ncbi:MAG: hypothetical protein K0S21_3246 [Rhizobiaceae bacterium]|nr:hypothetical protein [Rhizobiaceae bacterium]